MDTNMKNNVEALDDVFGEHIDAHIAVAELDPKISEAFVNLAETTKNRGQIEPKYRELISMALAASCTHLAADRTRVHMRHALKLGATKEEICETLELISVLGIHGVIPGAQIISRMLGGLSKMVSDASPEKLARAKDVRDVFFKARGQSGDIWETNFLLFPDFTEAYAQYSGTPWKTSALPGKIKEFMYVAVDLSPTHGDVGGAEFHMKTSLESHGATMEELLELIEIIGLFGFQTQLMALPILQEELDRIG